MLFELLEARQLLSAENIVWLGVPDLTISFAPDGADVAGQPNRLNEAFSAVGQAEVWQDAIVRGFETWRARRVRISRSSQITATHSV